MPALRTAVTQAGPAARLVGDVVLEVGLGGGSSAGGGGAGGVPDLGQVPQLAARIMPGRLEPVITRPSGDRVHRERQVPLPGYTGCEPPGSVPARRPGPASGGEGESWPARWCWPAGGPAVCVPAGRAGSAGRPGVSSSGGRLRWFLGTGRAQPCPIACPYWSVTVRHQVVLGLAAAARARSRASHGSTGPAPGSPPAGPPAPARWPAGRSGAAARRTRPAAARPRRSHGRGRIRGIRGIPGP